MLRMSAAVAAIALTLAVSACMPAAPTVESTPATPIDTSAPEPTETPDEVTAQTSLIIGPEGLTLVSDGGETFAAYADGPALLDLVESVAGPRPEGVPFEEFDGYDFGDMATFDWGPIMVSASPSGQAPASIRVSADTVGTAQVETVSGLTVGSTRTDAVGAGAWDEWDADQDGVADYLAIDPVEVDGTQSLVTPGEVGRQYITIEMDGNAVSGFQAPGNDFGDL